jgi:ABC-type polysaccharide/polyol phosphate export permease
MSTLGQAFGDAAVLTRRNVVKNRRTPDILFWTILTPIAFALLFAYVFGSAIDIPGMSYREYLIAGILVQTMLNTSMITGGAIAEETRKGITDRLRSLPIAQSAVLVARVTSDAVTNVVILAVMAGTGLLVGWRIRSSVPAALAGFLLLLLFAYACAWITTWLGITAKSPQGLANALMMLILPMIFISNAFVPSGGLPGGLRTIAEWSPVSAVVAATRELFGNVATPSTSDAWPMRQPILTSVAWIGLILIIFVPLAVRRYGKAVAR